MVLSNGEGRDQHVQEVAVTRLRRVSNAKVRSLGKQEPIPRKGPAGARAESRDSFTLSLPLGGHVLPSVLTCQASEQEIKVSLNVWVLRVPRGLQSSLWPGIQGLGQRRLQPGLTKPRQKKWMPLTREQRTAGTSEQEGRTWRCFAPLCLCSRGQTEDQRGDLPESCRISTAW